MLDQIKKKRLNLTHELITDRPRIKSSQKRKLIQANLQKFKKDVTANNSPFQSANNFYKGPSNLYLNESPTMKDLISPLKQVEQQKQQKKEVESPRFKQIKQQKQTNKQNGQNSQPIKVQQNKVKQEQIPQRVQNKSDNYQISNSSLFRQLQNYNDQKLNKVQRRVTFSKQTQENNSEKINKIKQQPQQTDNNNQLNFNYNQSGYGQSSNGSSAILFTSQFREYINKDKDENENKNKQPQANVSQASDKKQKNQANIQPVTQSIKRKTQSSHADKQIGQSFLKMGDQQLSSQNESRKKLFHNQSGRSLAFSNNDESMIRQSKATQLIAQQIVNKKLGEELVLDMDHFNKNKINNIIERYSCVMLGLAYKSIQKDLRLLNELIKFRRKFEKSLVRYCFDGFLILKQLKFQQVKNKIKADNFSKQLIERLIKSSFNGWKDNVKINEKKVIQSTWKRQQKLKRNIFKVFRMIWFDNKVKHQVDLYFLSKVFNSFRSITKSQRKKSQTTALKQYCKTLKRTYFYKMQQGIQAMKKQRLNQQLAYEHYKMTILKKFYDAWLQQCDRAPQYISLTMTSKNMFKQTLDNKWLGMKTVDFKQIRQ